MWLCVSSRRTSISPQETRRVPVQGKALAALAAIVRTVTGGTEIYELVPKQCFTSGIFYKHSFGFSPGLRQLAAAARWGSLPHQAPTRLCGDGSTVGGAAWERSLFRHVLSQCISLAACTGRTIIVAKELFITVLPQQDS